MKEPQRYVPLSRREVLRPEKKRELAYGVGIEEKPGEFGMIAGPFKLLTDALEIDPLDHDHACIIKFFPNGTDKVIYRWQNEGKFGGSGYAAWEKV